MIRHKKKPNANCEGADTFCGLTGFVDPPFRSAHRWDKTNCVECLKHRPKASGAKVFCYRNLNRKGVVWSVKNVKSGLVVDRTPTVVLSDVTLKVSQAGRLRVLREQRKNVHAGIQGKRIKRAPKGVWVRAEYNPYKWNSFVVSMSGRGIESALYAKLTPKGLYVMLKEHQGRK